MAEELPLIACVPQALPIEELKRFVALSHELFATVQEVRSLPDGYAMRFVEEPGLLYRPKLIIPIGKPAIGLFFDPKLSLEEVIGTQA